MSHTNAPIKFHNKDFDLEVVCPLPTEGIYGLFGPSGSGKTTLIRCLAGLLRPYDADIRVGGTVWQSDSIFLPSHQRRVGVVFQDIRLFSHLNVLGNLLFGHKRTPAAQRKISLDEVIEILELGQLLDKRPGNISGGEAQRVAIGRALLTSPSLLLMDEPLAALGEQHKKDILPFLRKLPENFGIPILYVSHNFEEMASLASYVSVMEKGRILTSGNLPETAFGLPDVMNRWAPDNLLDVTSHGSGKLMLGDGQILHIQGAEKTTKIWINARDMTLIDTPPARHGAAAILKGSMEKYYDLQTGQNMARISVAGQPVYVMASEQWLKNGEDVYVMVNRIKLI